MPILKISEMCIASGRCVPQGHDITNRFRTREKPSENPTCNALAKCNVCWFTVKWNFDNHIIVHKQETKTMQKRKYYTPEEKVRLLSDCHLFTFGQAFVRRASHNPRLTWSDAQQLTVQCTGWSTLGGLLGQRCRWRTAWNPPSDYCCHPSQSAGGTVPAGEVDFGKGGSQDIGAVPVCFWCVAKHPSHLPFYEKSDIIRQDITNLQTRKSKPTVRWGRKVMGLWKADRQTAEVFIRRFLFLKGGIE